MIRNSFSTAILLTAAVCMQTSVSAIRQDLVTIDTPSGNLTGVITAVPRTFAPVYQFRKIPFAKPPVGDLRFRNPEPYGKWEGVLNATEFGPSCIQPEFPIFEGFVLPNNEYAEDCLFLNIYVPGKLSKESKLPVMIWVHGGAYIMGQGTFYGSSSLASFGDVIVVTINYRLAILGFFSLENEAARGNYGLWDQKMAFEWVHNNIAAFGGDPNSVTIFGESAGGFSVSLQALVPSNKGLFQRVIAQSGTSHNDFGLSKVTGTVSRQIAEKLDCNMPDDDNTQGMMDCLRKRAVEDINGAFNTEDFMDPNEVNFSFPLAPVMDGVLFKDRTPNLLSESYPDVREFFFSLDFMVGSTSHEGCGISMMLSSAQIQEKHDCNATVGIPTHLVCDVIGRSFLQTIAGGLTEEAAAAVCEHYTDKTSLEAQSMRAVDMFGDVMFVAPGILAVNLHSTANSNPNTYLYRFSKIDPRPLFPLPPWFKGSCHGNDLFYTFGEDFLTIYNGDKEVPEGELKVINSVMRYWTNFAKSGNPNKPETPENGVEWPEYDPESQKFIDIDWECTINSKLSPGAAKLWIETVPELLKKGDKSREEL